MFAGINMFWARLRVILARAARRGLNIFMPANNVNCITDYYYNHFGGNWENKKKMTTNDNKTV